MGERHGLAAGAGVRDLLARGLADVPAWVDHQNPISQVDLVQMQGVQHRLLLVCDGPVCFAGSEHDGAREGEIAVRLAQFFRKPSRAADADDLRSIEHGPFFHEDGSVWGNGDLA